MEAGGGGGGGGALSGVGRGGEGAQPPGLRTPRLRQVRLQVENTPLLLTGERGRWGRRRGGGEAVGWEERREGAKEGREEVKQGEGERQYLSLNEVRKQRPLLETLSHYTVKKY